MNDPIVEEVRRIREAQAARFNYDLDAIFQDIKQREQNSGFIFVDGVARQHMPDKSLSPTEAATPVAHPSDSRQRAGATAEPSSVQQCSRIGNGTPAIGQS